MTCKNERWIEKLEKYACYKFEEYNTKKCRPSAECYDNSDDIKEIIEGSLHDSISDWWTGYSFKEDLPHIAEVFTEDILNQLAEFGLEIVKKEFVDT